MVHGRALVSSKSLEEGTRTIIILLIIVSDLYLGRLALEDGKAAAGCALEVCAWRSVPRL